MVTKHDRISVAAFQDMIVLGARVEQVALDVGNESRLAKVLKQVMVAERSWKVSELFQPGHCLEVEWR